MNLEALAERVFRGMCDANGGTARFYNIDGIGHKVFYCERSRDFSYKMQKLASLHGLGPKCHSRFIVHHPVEGMQRAYWGFITEIAPDLWKAPNREYLTGDKHRFLKKFQEKGFQLNDTHDGNFGLLNGRIVCIDFGHPSHTHLEYSRKRDS